MIMIIKFIFNISNFCVIVIFVLLFFLSKLLMLVISFSTVVNAAFVAELVFKLAKFVFSAKLEVSTCEIFLMSVFDA